MFSRVRLDWLRLNLLLIIFGSHFVWIEWILAFMTRMARVIIVVAEIIIYMMLLLFVSKMESFFF